ncbi:MAG: hypothetical protein DRJ35_08440 [Thermoprotei archaeon]|nr:MAG: hypothetical protein DRJ35_08440 [Thermoprotei archaeon]
MEQCPIVCTDSDIVRNFFEYLIEVAPKYNEKPLTQLIDIKDSFYLFASNDLFGAMTEEDIYYLWDAKIPIFCSLGSLDGEVIRYLEQTVKKEEITEDVINTFSNLAVKKSMETASITDFKNKSEEILELMARYINEEITNDTIECVIDVYSEYVRKRAPFEPLEKEKLLSKLYFQETDPYDILYTTYCGLLKALEKMRYNGDKLFDKDAQDRLWIDYGHAKEHLNTGETEKKEKQEEPEFPVISFDDVIGLSDAKDIVSRKLILPARNPELGIELGEDTANLLVLYGPPGTGKTMFARAISSELDAGYQEIGTIHGRYIGDSEKKLDVIFSAARKRMIDERKDVVLYFDEITQSFDPERRYDRILIDKLKSILSDKSRLVHTTPEREKFHIYVLASTNHIEQLDQTLLRSERALAIEIPLPNTRERELLWKQKLEGKNIDGAVDYAALAQKTQGMSGADIVAIVNEQKYLAGIRLETILNGRRLHECMDELEKLAPKDPSLAITQTTVEKAIRLYKESTSGFNPSSPEGLFA